MSIRKLFLLSAITYFFTIILFILLTGINIRPSQEEFALLCVSGTYPNITRGIERDSENIKLQEDTSNILNQAESNAESIKQPDKDSEKYDESEESQIMVGKEKESIIVNDNDEKQPLVIIYHTHATESYQPVTEGNFHSLGLEGTVREVGEVLRKELEASGYRVIHDKTLHDAESYNQSYSRSVDTLNKILADNNPVAIIDLHRDAASYTGNEGKTVLIDGENVACFSMVVGKGNENYDKLYSLAKSITDKAEEMYKGFGGRIITKPYKYNQSISDRCILLEIGNNENDIREAKRCGKYLGIVLADVLAKW